MVLQEPRKTGKNRVRLHDGYMKYPRTESAAERRNWRNHEVLDVLFRALPRRTLDHVRFCLHLPTRLYIGSTLDLPSSEECRLGLQLLACRPSVPLRLARATQKHLTSSSRQHKIGPRKNAGLARSSCLSPSASNLQRPICMMRKRHSWGFKGLSSPSP